jgi:hypothetical protein
MALRRTIKREHPAELLAQPPHGVRRTVPLGGKFSGGVVVFVGG